jgi:tryptophan synthase beta chain
MASSSARRAAESKRRVPASELRRTIRDLSPPVKLSIDGDGFDLIAEIKLRAPSAGPLAAAAAVPGIARAYAAAGAAAISVVTEPARFGGSLGILATTAREVEVPVMLKDFLVDPYQVLEARAHGASGALLIVRMLPDETLAAMLDTAREAGLFVLLESFDAGDLARAIACAGRDGASGPPILFGVNARDLATLEVDRSRLASMASQLPAGAISVAESGIDDPDAAQRAAAAGYRMALVGTSLMRSPDPEAAAASLLAAGRVARGRFGPFGGRYVPETLVPALAALDAGARAALGDPAFTAALGSELSTWVGRPTPLTRAARLSAAWGAEIWLKREDLAHTGAHKINNAIGQALLARRLAASRVIAETGAGQHGVATAAACARVGLACTVYMGTIDVARQRPNVDRMLRLGAEVRPVDSGDRTLRAAIGEAMRDWVAHPAESYYLLGSVVGPHPYPWLVRELQSVIGREARAQMLEQAGALPDVAVACVGGGSNSIGLFHPFLADAAVALVGVEAGGRGGAPGEHAATLARGRPGVLHGSYSILLQDADGQILETHSISAGLDYPGVGPEHADLSRLGRVAYVTASDDEALDAAGACCALEGILPALESAHALAGARRHAAAHPGARILVGLSGRGDKDLAAIAAARPLRGAP